MAKAGEIDGTVRVHAVTDVMVDRAIRAWNDWPVDHPITAQWKQDSSWQAMRRALAAAITPTGAFASQAEVRAAERLYVALSRYLDQNYPCDNQPEIEAAIAAWQDVRAAVDQSSERPADTPARGAGDAESHGRQRSA